MSHVQTILKTLSERGPMRVSQMADAIPEASSEVIRSTMGRLYREGRVNRVGFGVYCTGPQSVELKALRRLCEEQQREIERLKRMWL